jgi:hypothetical protein
MDDEVLNKHRLSDRIFYALKLAIHQKDLKTADLLLSALDMSMTRNSGGGEFVERREYSPAVEAELQKLRDLKKSSSI